MQAGGKWQKSPLKASSAQTPKPSDIWEKVRVEGRMKTWLGACFDFMDNVLATSEPVWLL